MCLHFEDPPSASPAIVYMPANVPKICHGAGTMMQMNKIIDPLIVHSVLYCTRTHT